MGLRRLVTPKDRMSAFIKGDPAALHFSGYHIGTPDEGVPVPIPGENTYGVIARAPTIDAPMMPAPIKIACCVVIKL